MTTLLPSCAVVMKSRNLNFLELSGPLQTCNGTALPLHVSGDYVPIIRRNNCIYATRGTCYSVWMNVWYAGWNGMALFTRCALCNFCRQKCATLNVWSCVKMDLTKSDRKVLDWIDMGQERDRRRATVNSVMNLRVP